MISQYKTFHQFQNVFPKKKFGSFRLPSPFPRFQFLTLIIEKSDFILLYSKLNFFQFVRVFRKMCRNSSNFSIFTTNCPLKGKSEVGSPILPHPKWAALNFFKNYSMVSSWNTIFDSWRESKRAFNISQLSLLEAVVMFQVLSAPQCSFLECSMCSVGTAYLLNLNPSNSR